jgi:hypothetical protein
MAQLRRLRRRIPEKHGGSAAAWTTYLGIAKHKTRLLENRIMRTLRWIPLLVALLLMLYGGLPQAWATDYSLGVAGSLAGGPTPAAVGPGVTSSATLSASSESPSLQQEAYLVTSSWTWSLAAVGYSVDGITWTGVGSGQSCTANMTSPSSSTTGVNLACSPGYWYFSYLVSVYYADNMGNTWNGYSVVGVPLTVVNVNIAVRQHGSSDDYASTVEIAAGHIDSDAHKADVKITCSPAVAARVRVDLTGGTGDTTATNADLAFGSTHIGPGSYGYVTTASNGTTTGMLLSNDVLNASTISGGGTSASATFGWDNYEEDDKWDLSPSYIVEGDASDIAVTFAHNGNVMNGHTILFTIEQVVYENPSGVVQPALWNTPESPSDLSSWAYFDNATCATDSTGTASNRIHFQSQATNHAIWIKLRVYDMTVTGQ